jgi:hypothetical protein
MKSKYTAVQKNGTYPPNLCQNLSHNSGRSDIERIIPQNGTDHNKLENSTIAFLEMFQSKT